MATPCRSPLGPTSTSLLASRPTLLLLHELLDDALIVRHLRVRNEDVVFVKGIFEASEGLCAMFAERGGDLTVLAPVSRAHELDAVLNDLALELNGVLEELGAKAPVPASPSS
jgi:hypothetical protein